MKAQALSGETSLSSVSNGRKGFQGGAGSAVGVGVVGEGDVTHKRLGAGLVRRQSASGSAKVPVAHTDLYTRPSTTAGASTNQGWGEEQSGPDVPHRARSNAQLAPVHHHASSIGREIGREISRDKLADPAPTNEQRSGSADLSAVSSSFQSFAGLSLSLSLSLSVCLSVSLPPSYSPTRTVPPTKAYIKSAKKWGGKTGKEKNEKNQYQEPPTTKSHHHIKRSRGPKKMGKKKVPAASNNMATSEAAMGTRGFTFSSCECVHMCKCMHKYMCTYMCQA